jgi:hypothetical protein
MHIHAILAYRRASMKWIAAFPKLGTFDAVDLLGKAGPSKTSGSPNIERDPKAPAPLPRHDDSLHLAALTLQPGEELIVGKRIRKVLTEAARQPPEARRRK